MNRALILGALLLGAQAFAGEYLLKYANSNAYNLLNSLSASPVSGVHVVDHNSTASLLKIDVDQKKELLTLASLLSQPGVEYIVPNAKIEAFANPVDVAALRQQWALGKVQAEKAWTRAGNKGNKNIIVAVIDTGVDYRHESLAPNMVAGYNFKDKNDDPMDKTGPQNPGHGTHCAGVVGATGLIDNGTVGIAAGVSIMPLRFLGENGSGDLNDAIKAVDYAVEKGAHVISASWGASIPRAQAAPLLEAIKRADDKGVIFVSAAANDGRNNDTTEVYPANNGFPNSITVAASDSSDNKPSWSNYGTAKVHLASPGADINSTLPGNKYGSLSGTSMATPLVSGMAALLKSQDGSLTGAQIRAILQTTGVKVSIQTACNCRVDAFAAVDAVLSKKLMLVPAAATLALKDTLNLSVFNGKEPFKYVSSNVGVATVSDSGVVTAVAKGTTAVSVTDADGKTASTLDINVGETASKPDPGNPGGPGDGSCPIGDQAMCDIICKIQPDLPFCKK